MKTALAGGEKAIVPIVMATHAGITTDEFADVVQDWTRTARHPKTGHAYTEMVYPPMLELLSFLRQNGFKTSGPPRAAELASWGSFTTPTRFASGPMTGRRTWVAF